MAIFNQNWFLASLAAQLCMLLSIVALGSLFFLKPATGSVFYYAANFIGFGCFLLSPFIAWSAIKERRNFENGCP